VHRTTGQAQNDKAEVGVVLSIGQLAIQQQTTIVMMYEFIAAQSFFLAGP
jgi:hypothetical protein